MFRGYHNINTYWWLRRTVVACFEVVKYTRFQNAAVEPNERFITGEITYRRWVNRKIQEQLGFVDPTKAADYGIILPVFGARILVFLLVCHIVQTCCSVLSSSVTAEITCGQPAVLNISSMFTLYLQDPCNALKNTFPPKKIYTHTRHLQALKSRHFYYISKVHKSGAA